MVKYIIIFFIGFCITSFNTKKNKKYNNIQEVIEFIASVPEQYKVGDDLNIDVYLINKNDSVVEFFEPVAIFLMEEEVFAFREHFHKYLLEEKLENVDKLLLGSGDTLRYHFEVNINEAEYKKRILPYSVKCLIAIPRKERKRNNSVYAGSLSTEINHLEILE